MSMRQLVVLLIAAIASFPVFTKEARVFRFGVEEVSYYPLHNFADPSKPALMRQILEAFARHENIEIEFIPLPIQRFSLWFQENEIDFRAPDHPTWFADVSPTLSYSVPIIALCESTVVLKAHQQKPFDDFKTIGTLHGFTLSANWYQREKSNRVQKITDPSLKVLTRMLLNGMVDGLNNDISAVRHEMEQLGRDPDEVVVADEENIGVLSYRISTQHEQALLHRFNAFIKANPDLIRSLADALPFYAGHPCGNPIPRSEN